MTKKKEVNTNLIIKPPVVTFLGHVDHGKTSILDYIRKAHVQAGEPGGITQHVRAHQISYNDKKITFIDTPGHEVFTEMRSRGGQVADIAVLVVAADDSVKPQTKEAIQHIKKAGATVIVAANKIDLPGADIDKVKQDLANNDVLVEEWGGDVPIIPLSAKTGENIDKLLEMILLVAEMKELKADSTVQASGVILESRLDSSLGAVTTVLVKEGTLRLGEYVLCNEATGKIRALLDTEGNNIEMAEPADPVSILGIREVLPVGGIFTSAKTPKELEIIVKEEKEKEELIEEVEELSVLELLGMQEVESKKKTLSVVLKTDASGTLEAIEAELNSLSDEDVEVKVIQSGTGDIVEKDVIAAKNSRGLVVGFNVGISDYVKEIAKRERVITRIYNIIYELVDEIDDVLTSMIDVEAVEINMGELEVRQVFILSDKSIVAGCVVKEGTCAKGQRCYIERAGERIAEGKVNTLRVLKEEVNKVKKGQECGVVISPKFEIESGDKIVCFRIEK